VQIEFEDSGIGIPGDKLMTIFEADLKKSTPGTENEKGTGLGLLVVKEFIFINKGNIRIESDPVKGTTVTITLPSC
jgi:signal transduction histidine kinase